MSLHERPLAPTFFPLFSIPARYVKLAGMMRPFRPDDAGPCNALIRSCIERDAGLSPCLRRRLLTEETPELMLRRSGRYYLAVYESDDGVAGLGGLDLNELSLLYVAPEVQGRGIGSAVLTHLESLVPPALFADVFVYASPSAVGFYTLRGYQGQGEYFFDLGGEKLATVFMNKLMNQGLQD
jgi:GNAT superfamily N-acetyltransferase